MSFFDRKFKNLNDQIYYLLEEMSPYSSDYPIILQSTFMALYDTVNILMSPMASYLLKDTMPLIALIINGKAPSSTDIESRLSRIQGYGFATMELSSIAQAVYFLGKAVSDPRQSRYTNITLSLFHVMELSVFNKEYFLECIKERLPPKIIFRK